MNNTISMKDVATLEKIENMGKEMETLRDDTKTLRLMDEIISSIKEIENKDIALVIVDSIIDKLWELDYPLGTQEWNLCFDIKRKLTDTKHGIVKSMS